MTQIKSPFTLCVRLTDAQKDKLIKYTETQEPKVTTSDVVRQLVDSDFLELKDVLHQLKEEATERGCTLLVLLTTSLRALTKKKQEKEKV
jgi:hypothetical protein